MPILKKLPIEIDLYDEIIDVLEDVLGDNIQEVLDVPALKKRFLGDLEEMGKIPSFTEHALEDVFPKWFRENFTGCEATLNIDVEHMGLQSERQMRKAIVRIEDKGPAKVTLLSNDENSIRGVLTRIFSKLNAHNKEANKAIRDLEYDEINQLLDKTKFPGRIIIVDVEEKEETQ